jgi:NADH-quinone oxidoreductase subunit M
MLLWLGLYPQPVLNTARPAITEQLQAYTKPLPSEAERVRQATVFMLPPDSLSLNPFKGGAYDPK